VYIIHVYGSGFTTLIRFNYWILCETVLPGQGGVPRLAEVDFTDTDTDMQEKITLYLPCATGSRSSSLYLSF
jgi:hypothetical protein